LVEELLDARAAIAQGEVQYALAARMLRSAAKNGYAPEALAAVQDAAQTAAQTMSGAVLNLAESVDVYG
jgi:hypothetical protein